MDFHFQFAKDEWNGGDSIKVYGFATTFEGSNYLTVEGGKLKLNPKGEGEPAKEPMFELTRANANSIMRGLTEALARVGFIAEIDNKQRIVAEALNGEKDKQIEYFKERIKGFEDYLLIKNNS